MAIIKKERMFSIPVQISPKQYEICTQIMEKENVKFFAEHVRNAVDFYNAHKNKELGI